MSNCWKTLVILWISPYLLRSYQLTWRIGKSRLGHFWQWQLKQQVVQTGFEYLFALSYEINNLEKINVIFGVFLKMTTLGSFVYISRIIFVKKSLSFIYHKILINLTDYSNEVHSSMYRDYTWRIYLSKFKFYFLKIVSFLEHRK